jgi:putative copper resistance protein D
LVLCRTSFYAAASVLYGCGSFVAFLAPPRLGQEINSPFRTASIVALLASLAWLPLQAAVIGDGWTSALDYATLSALGKTTGGTAWLVPAAGSPNAAARPGAMRGRKDGAAAFLVGRSYRSLVRRHHRHREYGTDPRPLAG